MARGIGTRYLFLLIRGIDQTGRAISKPLKEMTELQKAEANLGRQSYRLMFAGAAFTTFGLLATRALLSTMEYSTRGARVLGDLTEVFDRLKKAMGERIVDNMGDMITGWIDKLDNLTSNEAFGYLTGEVALTLTLGAVGIGVGITAIAIGAALIGKVVALLVTGGFITAATGTAVMGGIVGTAITIAIPVILSMIVADIVWKLLPKQYREHAEKMKADAQAWADKTQVPVRYGQRDVAYPSGMNVWSAKGAGITSAQVVNNTNLFIDSLSTKVENEDELVELMEGLFASGVISITGYEPDVDNT